ncbi:hypothetical protein HQ529_02285 [Candidatus Woesearchaeota archaeon]|nr:hypothetical protein [Candidatus Woesearchaeota archaeon]
MNNGLDVLEVNVENLNWEYLMEFADKYDLSESDLIEREKEDNERGDKILEEILTAINAEHVTETVPKRNYSDGKIQQNLYKNGETSILVTGYFGDSNNPDGITGLNMILTHPLEGWGLDYHRKNIKNILDSHIKPDSVNKHTYEITMNNIILDYV